MQFFSWHGKDMPQHEHNQVGEGVEGFSDTQTGGFRKNVYVLDI